MVANKNAMQRWLFSHKKKKLFWVELKVETVPILKLNNQQSTIKKHNIGVVPTFTMYYIGTVPTFQMHNTGTKVFSFFCKKLLGAQKYVLCICLGVSIGLFKYSFWLFPCVR